MKNKVGCIYIVLFLFFTGIYTKTYAQSGNFVTYGLEEGLVTSQIETIAQDQKGYLWVGTIAGLSRYDGYTFTNYTQKDGLAEDWITTSFEDKQGNIWFGHWGGGVSFYNLEADSIKDLELESYSKYKLITDIQQDNQGVMWFGTENAGLFSYDPIKKEALRVQSELPSVRIADLVIDQYEKLWVATDIGTYILDPSNRTNPKILSSSVHTSAKNVSSMINAFSKEIWISTTNNGIQKLKYNKDYSVIKHQSFSTLQGLPSQQIKTLYKDQSSNIWIGSKDKGVVQFIPTPVKKGYFSKGELNVFSNKFEMKYYHANTFGQDREGNIWIGTEIGLNKYMGDVFKVYNHNDDLSNNLVWSILQDRKERMWFGTTGGISIFTFPIISGRKQYNSPDVKNISVANGLSENIVIALCQASSNDVWVGTENKGINILNEEGKVIKKITEKQGLADNKVFSICEDNDKNMWVGTRNGVSKINPYNYTITNYTGADGLGGEKVYKIYKDSKGYLWFGILGGALTRHNGKSFKTYEEGDGLSQNFILSITEDKNKNIWLGTYGDGVIKYDGTRFTSYTTAQGLSSNSTHFITTDKAGDVWVGQSLGIERFNDRTETFSLYGKQQGFAGLETNENAVCKDSEGNIWFGTLRGAIKFAPYKDKKNEVEPQTYINKVKIFFNDVALQDGQELSYQENYLTFNSLGISLTNPGEVRYRYFLEGFDSEWSPETSNSAITYSNLAPGKYTFNVKAINNSGVENIEPTSLSFTVNPPFWKTWWFYLLCLILAIAAVVFYVKWREKSLKERQEFLETEVQKRTEELRKEKEIVDKQNQNIKESISYAKKIQQAILPPLNDVKKALPNSFIMYEPKDIVSGDFYWVHESKEKTLFAAVDCTGHGVPGAFMSIIGHNLLDKVVKEHNITEPAKILDILSKEIQKTLRQNSNEDGVKDGMDLSVCSIDKNSNTLEFAGAYNPLYLIRKGEIKEVKSDKIPIGKKGVESGKQFNNTVIPLEKGDMLYLFSDGYADQKGGPKSKKFYYPPFRQLLTDIHSLPLEKQKETLEKTMLDWKGNIEQYDDMLIFGVKI